MKHSLCLLTVVLAGLVSCKQTNYVINGTAPENCEGCEVYLSFGEFADTTVVTDGKFCFTGEVGSADIANVRLVSNDKKFLFNHFVIEPAKISVSLAEDGVCTGTKLNEEYAASKAAQDALMKVYRENQTAAMKNAELSLEERNAIMEKNYESYKSQLDSMNSIVFANHPDDILGASAMMMIQDSKEAFDSLYNLAGGWVKSYYKVTKEKNRYEQIEKTSVGCMFTDFEIGNGNADGTAVKLSDYVGKGKYILVDFWASWCGPCKQEISNLANIYPKYKSDKFEILGVAVWDKRADTEKALTVLPISWPVIFDAQQIPTDIYGINGIPELILFGPDGTIVARGLRGEEIPNFLDTVL